MSFAYNYLNFLVKRSIDIKPFIGISTSPHTLERLAVSVKFNEPVLLVGETGTGKTTLVQNLASRLGQKLTVLVCLLLWLVNGNVFCWQFGVCQAGWVLSLGQNNLFKYKFKQVSLWVTFDLLNLVSTHFICYFYS